MSYLFCPGWLVHIVNYTSITHVQMYSTPSNYSQLIHKQSHKLIISVLFRMIYLCCPSYSILLGNAFSLIFWDWDRLVHYFFVEKDVWDPTYSMGYRCTLIHVHEQYLLLQCCLVFIFGLGFGGGGGGAEPRVILSARNPTPALVR
jgi:hypothetical protein